MTRSRGGVSLPQARKPAPSILPNAGAPRWNISVRLGLAALVVFVFGQSLGHGFIAFDDPSYVTDNEIVRQGITARGVLWALTTSDRFYWHPRDEFAAALQLQPDFPEARANLAEAESRLAHPAIRSPARD